MEPTNVRLNNFKWPDFYTYLTPKTRITLSRSIIEDEDKPDQYPIFDSQNSRNGRYVYHSPDRKINYIVYLNNDNTVIVQRDNNQGALFTRNFDYMTIEPEGSISIFNHQVRETRIADDGSAFILERQIKVMDFKASSDISEWIEKRSIKGFNLNLGVDLANIEGSMGYITQPKINYSEKDGKYYAEQYEFSLDGSAGASMGIKITVPGERISWNSFKLTPISISAGPGFEYINGEINNYPMNELERYRLRLEGIENTYKKYEPGPNEYNPANPWTLAKVGSDGTNPMPDDLKKLLEKEKTEITSEIEKYHQLHPDKATDEYIRQILEGKNASENRDELLELLNLNQSFTPMGGRAGSPADKTPYLPSDSLITTGKPSGQSGAGGLDLSPLLSQIEANIQKLKKNLSS